MSETEGLNNGIMEAGAMGKMVIATTAGAAPEMIKNYKTGLLCDRNVQSLVDRLEWCKQNISKIEIMGGFLRESICRDWSWDKCIVKYDDMFNSICG